jgi:phosphoribosylformimino-5-aminoimidazole carboxamide ribotide isomerase
MRSTTYADDPIKFLEATFGMMPPRLHLVDLTGARTGQFELFALVPQLVSRGIDLEVGGGIRRIEDVARLVDSGVRQIVLGTQVVKDLSFRQEVFERFASYLVMALDVRDDRIQIGGWDQPGPRAREFWQELYREGWTKANVTDIDRDGTLGGLREEFWQSWSREPGDLAAGGGVGSMLDLEQLERWGLKRVVVGKAWIEGTIPKEVFLGSC